MPQCAIAHPRVRVRAATPLTVPSGRGGSWARIRKEAVKDGNLELAQDLDWLVAPVIVNRGGEGNPCWQMIPYAEVKELRKSVKDYQGGSPYFKNLLDLTFTGHTLVPYDIRYIMTALLSPTVFLGRSYLSP